MLFRKLTGVVPRNHVLFGVKFKQSIHWQDVISAVISVVVTSNCAYLLTIVNIFLHGTHDRVTVCLSVCLSVCVPYDDVVTLPGCVLVKRHQYRRHLLQRQRHTDTQTDTQYSPHCWLLIDTGAHRCNHRECAQEWHVLARWDHTVSPAIHPSTRLSSCLYSLSIHQMAPPEWGSAHAITAHYSFINLKWWKTELA